MSWQLTPYVVPLLLATVTSILSAVYVYVWLTCHHIATSRMAVLLLVAGAIWIPGTAFESAGTGLATRAFWDKFEYLGICIIPAAWLAFSLRYIGRARWLTPNGRLLISIVPLICGLFFIVQELVHAGTLRRWQATGVLFAAIVPLTLSVWEQIVAWRRFTRSCVSARLPRCSRGRAKVPPRDRTIPGWNRPGRRARAITKFTISFPTHSQSRRNGAPA